MLVFLDTEFTDLAKPELLSLGLVAINGLEHYGELDLNLRRRPGAPRGVL
jgi:hypothetical protein